jgi:hypothetical protein
MHRDKDCAYKAAMKITMGMALREIPAEEMDYLIGMCEAEMQDRAISDHTEPLFSGDELMAQIGNNFGEIMTATEVVKRQGQMHKALPAVDLVENLLGGAKELCEAEMAPMLEKRLHKHDYDIGYRAHLKKFQKKF